MQEYSSSFTTPNASSILGLNSGNNFPLFSSFDKSNGLNVDGTMKIPKATLVPDAIKTPNINDLKGSIAAKDAKNLTSAADAKKLTDATNLANGIGVASMLTDPILGASEGLLKAGGAKFADKDTMSSAVDAASGVASMFGPAGQAIGIGLKVLDFADRGLGKTVKGFEGNTGTSAYQDFTTKGGTNRLSQGQKSKNMEVEKQQNQNLYASAMSNINTQKKNTLSQEASIANTIMRNKQLESGGFGTQSLVAKEGTKLDKLREYKNTLKFKQGGKLKEAHNVIPSGALHAHRNNLDIEGITPKGIPVVSVGGNIDTLGQPGNDNIAQMQAEGGEILQHAEIEKEEIILHLSLTQQIEKLRKEGTKEAQITAGKLLSQELMENTKDNVGILDEVKSEDINKE